MPIRHAAIALHHHHDHHGGGRRRSSQIAADSDVPDAKVLPSEFSRKAFLRCQHLPAIRKMNHGWFDDLTKGDVEQLFYALDADDSGHLDFGEIRLLLKEVLDPPCTDDAVNLLWEFTDQNEDGSICAEELHTALVAGPLKQHIRYVQHEFRIKQKFARSQGLHAHVNRELLRDVIADRVDNDDAFATLPFSMVFILIFITITTTHLHIFERQQVEDSIESWIEGYGTNLAGPYLDEHVANAHQYWEWLNSSGIESVLGDCGTADPEGWDECRLSSRHVLLSDLMMYQKSADDSERESWLIASPAGDAHLQAQPGDYIGAARAELGNLKAAWTNGEDRFPKLVELRFTTYCQDVSMFTRNRVLIEVDDYGRAFPQAISIGVIVDPYSSRWYIAMDAVYLAMIMYIMVFELKDLISACKHKGVMEGTREYVSIFNAIDWIGIIMALFNVILWAVCLVMMEAESILDLLNYEDGKTMAKLSMMSLNTEAIEVVNSDLEALSNVFWMLHIVMGLNVLTVVLRFFKAFNANPRLQIVINTLWSASTDIVHFGIVFFFVFLAFALLGHILFGGDLVQFSSLVMSTETAFIVLMGDFDWYVALFAHHSGLPSGMPIGAVMLWFWCFNLVVLLILLNMLLAIIMEHYAALMEETRSGAENPPVWIQADEYLKHRRDTKGFIALADLLLQLDRDDDPAHPQAKVTEESLLDAFPDMQAKQAEWMMKWLSKEARDIFKEGEDPEDIALLKEIESLIEGMTVEQREMKLNLKELARTLVDLKPQATDPEMEAKLNPAEVTSQLQAQGDAIKSMSRVVANMTTRMELIDPRMQAMPPDLMRIVRDVQSIKSVLDGLPDDPEALRQRNLRLEAKIPEGGFLPLTDESEKR